MAITQKELIDYCNTLSNSCSKLGSCLICEHEHECDIYSAKYHRDVPYKDNLLHEERYTDEVIYGDNTETVYAERR